MAKFLCKSLDDTKALAKRFGDLICDKGCFVSLFGEIGAGKTAFSKALLEHIGVKEAVTSPSFVILNEYHAKDENGVKHLPVYHFDLYRLEGEGVNTILGELVDYSRDGAITLVEWADFGCGELPFERIDLKISYDENDARTFEFEAVGEKYKKIVEAL